jgi:hypothetical protein
MKNLVIMTVLFVVVAATAYADDMSLPTRINQSDMCEVQLLTLEEERAQLRAQIHELAAKLEMCSVSEAAHQNKRAAIAKKYSLDSDSVINPDGSIKRKPKLPPKK